MIFENQDQLINMLKESLKDEYLKEDVERYASYCLRLKLEKKDGPIKKPWMQKRTVEELDQLFRRVHKEGLVFDGVHITLQSTGVSYDYQAYKNKMLLAYPESDIDLQLVYQGDKFSFSKESGKVVYSHQLSDPFDQKDENIIGGYCVIKNKRGEFLTTLSKERIEDHRAIAKTDFIWRKWFPEMCLKTVIRKATKYHFDDVFQGINEMDNENYDLENAGKTRLEKLNKQIVELLDIYQGEDKDAIRKRCQDAKAGGFFTEDYAEDIISDLGGEV